jgi:hypothetical protein
MSQKASKTKGRKIKKLGRKYEESFQEFASDNPVAREFRALLKEVDFVPKVINIYHRHELKDLHDWQEYGLGPSTPSFEQAFIRQEEFMMKYLSDRLYQATDTLFIEAVCAAIGRPMRRSLAGKLYHSIFVRRGPWAPPLRDGRNEVWDTAVLKWAIRVALPKIKNSRNVTLPALAKKINALPRKGLLKDVKKTLSGRYLQKLMKDHQINWIEIKRVYKSFLAEKERLQKSTQ